MSDTSSKSGSPELGISDKPKPPPRKKRKIKKKKQDDEEYNENKHFAKTLSQKFRNKKYNDHDPLFEVKKGKGSIKNSENHDSAIGRALEIHMNKLFQWEDNSEAIESAYLCALCHDGVKRDSYGELFGPYHATINNGKHWPKFLAKVPNSKKQQVKIELWFHGECILWAPNIHMAGNILTNLDTKMEIFWSQICEVCKKSGATIGVSNRKNQYLHHKCAKNKGCTFNIHSLTCQL